eukprot:GHVT01088515.1.p1 GENE.GHVT01088515.1~~GHVT01088515.1.p1  ORF type:complete len:412 (-),score=31.83 GHVT01088515.1:818-2053(-)
MDLIYARAAVAGLEPTHYQIPEEFPEMLMDYTREILRESPDDLIAFSVEYFDHLLKQSANPKTKARRKPLGDDPAASSVGIKNANLRIPSTPCGGGNGTLDATWTTGNISSALNSLLTKYDRQRVGSLSVDNFLSMLKELQKIWKFSDDDMFRFLAETEQLNDRVRYAKFADVAVRLMESLRPSSLQDKNASDSAHGDVHIWGLTLAEFHAALASSASEAATWSSNKSRGAVAAWFSGPAFGITRSVLNVLSFQLPRDTGGFLSLNKESAGRAWDILQKLAHLPYFQNSPPKLQMAQFIEDICKSKDVQLAGRLPSTVIVELLSSAMLGLSRWQLCGVLAAIPKDDNGRITYTSVANLIASRLTGSIAPVPVIVPPQVRVDPQDASDFSEMIRPVRNIYSTSVLRCMEHSR